MPIPLAIPVGIAVGGVLLSPSDSGSTDEIMKKVGFNHPEKYKQIHEGPGLGGLDTAVSGWSSKVAEDLEHVANLLDEANAKAGVTWTGEAAEQHGSSLKPMTDFIRDAREISMTVGDNAATGASHFGDIKHAMPEPVEVTATDSLLEKGGAWLVGGETDLQKQEREAQERAEQAKQYYERYDAATQSTTASLPSFPEPPQMAYDQGAQESTSRQTVNTPTNPSAIGSRQVNTGNYSIGDVGPGVGPGSGSGTGSGSGSTPAQSSSQWATPPTGTGGINMPNTGTGPGAGVPNTSTFGGSIFPTGPGTGAGAGRGGMGAGAGGRGLGAGAGRGPGIGAGGRAGVGGLGAGSGAGASGGVAGAGGRGGAAGAMGGAAGRGRGKEGEDDLEHENKYWVDNDDAWDELGLPKVAPPVFGDWSNDNY
ncbi:hypothetical protein GCM10011581_01890 [Saccharopolyspora subtropica]|uniref:PPE domain-containing protein n=1 Tax=Saccharopolyspora thermophila TaxID=89367 RepID=A0A917JKX8_9PSEU|nr:PPE domain-containing protein [Saccharopolyspora subtropica]GGI68580.1 hypothetical protein GCM10011581_01890 [Saccharopolyspora subtropica]